MCQSLMIHAQWSRFILTITSECLGAMLTNESYDAMNMMISYGVYYTSIETPTEKYKLPEQNMEDNKPSQVTKINSSLVTGDLSPTASIRSLSLKRSTTNKSLLGTEKGLETGF